MSNTRVVTGVGRLSYVNLLQMQQSRFGGEPKYSVTLLLPKSDARTKQMLDAAIEAAIQEGQAKLWRGQRPADLLLPIYDGDGNKPKGGAYGSECKGHWVMQASTKLKPRVVDLTLQDIMQPTEIYSGMYGRISVNFAAYDKGNRGIRVSLDNVQKTADGQPLGNHADPQDDFAAPAPAYQAPAPAYQAPVYQPPVQTQPAPAYQAPAYQPPVYQAPIPQQAPAYQPPAYQPPAQQAPAYQPPAYQPSAQQVPAYPPRQQAFDPITGQPVAPPVYGL